MSYLKCLRRTIIGTQKNSCVWCTWEPLLSKTWLSDLSQLVTDEGLSAISSAQKSSGWALLLLLAQCCPAFISVVKHSCIEIKVHVASPIVTAMKQKLSLWTHVQDCNFVWEVFLKSHVTPEKRTSSCAGLTTVRHGFSLGSYPSLILFLSSLLLFIFVTATFFFPSWSLAVCLREIIQERVAYLQFPLLLEDLYHWLKKKKNLLYRL